MEKELEVESPSLEEGVRQDAVGMEVSPSEPGMPEDSSAPEEMIKIRGERGWAPPTRGEGPVPIKDLGGRKLGKAGGRSELFGTFVGSKKLGVVVDVSGSMQPYLENVLGEVLANFPAAEVVLIDGCGMEEVGPNPPARSPTRTSSRGKKRPRPEVEVPTISTHIAEFNSREGQNSPAVGSWGGLRQGYPRLYKILRDRSDTWVIVGEDAPLASRLALEYLAGKHVQAIYWFSDFEDSVETREGEKAAQVIHDNQIEVYLHPMDGLRNIKSWSEKVGAKVIEVRVEKST